VVKATQNKVEMPVFRGLALLQSDKLGTSTESWSKIELDEGQFAIVEENTDIQIAVLAGKLAKDSKTTRVYMSGGKVWFDISKELKEGETFEVRTPGCALSVRGTFFSVSAEGSKGMALGVYNGKVAIRAERADGKPMLDKNGKEVAMELSSGSVRISFEGGRVSSVTQSELTLRDLAPLRKDGRAGPGGVYEVLRDRVEEKEELAQELDQLTEQLVNKQFEQMAEQQTEQQTGQKTEQQTEQQNEQQVGQLIEQPAFQGFEDMSRAEALQVMELLRGESIVPQTYLDMNNLNVIPVGDNTNPLPSSNIASITGNLWSGMGSGGAYSFEANLNSGEIFNGAMNGNYSGAMSITYDLHGGIGMVSGKNFDIENFQGSVNDSNFSHAITDVGRSILSGTAGKGFDVIGDIEASGIFKIIYVYDGQSYGIGGAIVDGRRVE